MDYYRTRKLLSRNDGYYVCLPRRFLKSLQWRAGDDLLIRKNEEDEICIRGKKREVKAVRYRSLLDIDEEDYPANSYEK